MYVWGRALVVKLVCVVHLFFVRFAFPGARRGGDHATTRRKKNGLGKRSIDAIANVLFTHQQDACCPSGTLYLVMVAQDQDHMVLRVRSRSLVLSS